MKVISLDKNVTMAIQREVSKYDKGVLNIFVPKKEQKKIENKQVIEIKQNENN